MEIVSLGVSYEYAFAVILAAAFGLDIVDSEEDKILFSLYFNITCFISLRQSNSIIIHIIRILKYQL